MPGNSSFVVIQWDRNTTNDNFYNIIPAFGLARTEIRLDSIRFDSVRWRVGRAVGGSRGGS